MKNRDLIWYLICALLVYATFAYKSTLTSILVIAAGLYCIILRKKLSQDTLEDHKKRSKKHPFLFPSIENEERWHKVMNALAIIVGLGFILAGTISVFSISRDQEALLTKYEEAFSLLETDKVKGFRDTDWCKYISYGDHEIYFVDQPYSACSTTSGKAGGFSEADLAEFQKIEKVFANKINSAYITYDEAGKIKSVWYLPNTCFWCDTSYYYSASGNPPELSPGFNLGDKLNYHWYKVFEEWP